MTSLNSHTRKLFNSLKLLHKNPLLRTHMNILAVSLLLILLSLSLHLYTSSFSEIINTTKHLSKILKQKQLLLREETAHNILQKIAKESGAFLPLKTMPQISDSIKKAMPESHKFTLNTLPNTPQTTPQTTTHNMNFAFRHIPDYEILKLMHAILTQPQIWGYGKIYEINMKKDNTSQKTGHCSGNFYYQQLSLAP